MGLFGFKKKKKEVKGQLPPLPVFQERPSLEPTQLKSEVQHITSKAPTLPEIPKPLPEFPSAAPEELPAEEAPTVETEEIRQEIPEAPQRLDLPEFPELTPLEKEYLKEESIDLAKEELEVAREREPIKPVFVTVDNFKYILDDVSKMKNDLKEAREAVDKFEEIRLEKDKKFEKMRTQVEDIQRKLVFIDTTIFETKHIR